MSKEEFEKRFLGKDCYVRFKGVDKRSPSQGTIFKYKEEPLMYCFKMGNANISFYFCMIDEVRIRGTNEWVHINELY